jgi:hypothetical protein
MNLRRVEWLIYRIHGSADYSCAARFECEDDGFRIEASGNRALLQPKAEHCSEEKAFAAAERLIADWEALAALRHGPGAFKLLFVGCKYEDAPAMPSVDRLSAEGIVTGSPELGQPTQSQIHRALPDFPVGLTFSGKAGQLLEMFKSAVTSQARWVDVGYYISTTLYDLSDLGYPKQGHDFKQASSALGISRRKLDRLHAIVGPRGNRKPGGGPPLTAEEEARVREICCEIVIKMAQLEAHSMHGDGQ